MPTWDDVVALGYTVREASAGVRFVSGFGLATYIAEGDQAQIDNLADPVLHAQRIAPPPDTIPPLSAPTALEMVAALDADTATVADVIRAIQDAEAS